MPQSTMRSSVRAASCIRARVRRTAKTARHRFPKRRRKAVPGVHLCVNCQEANDLEQAAQGGYNRRGSKDSQLR